MEKLCPLYNNVAKGTRLRHQSKIFKLLRVNGSIIKERLGYFLILKRN